jgi:hypothetical protein
VNAQDNLTSGEYRLARQAGGRGAFAHVRVNVTRDADTEGGSQLVWGAELNDSTSAQPDRDMDEVRAALAGATDALDVLAALGIDTNGCRITVMWLGINRVDTEPSAVRAAACAAVATALDVDDRVEVVYQGEWHCRPVLPDRPSKSVTASTERDAQPPAQVTTDCGEQLQRGPERGPLSR